ncbi:MAG: haloacid dehalogenase-like hydrolase, partial [Gemmatimonadetes bacterium]|nr:haloacid dehalogenase-like hydrolase [Gemmatimonadota bacterium]
VYVGDGSSDLHVMMHVNRGAGLTIAVSEARSIAQIAKRTIVTEDALGVLVPVLEDVVGYDPSRIRALLEVNGVLIQDWDRGRTDWLTLREDPARREKRREAAAGG